MCCLLFTTMWWQTSYPAVPSFLTIWPRLAFFISLSFLAGAVSYRQSCNDHILIIVFIPSPCRAKAWDTTLAAREAGKVCGVVSHHHGRQVLPAYRSLFYCNMIFIDCIEVHPRHGKLTESIPYSLPFFPCQLVSWAVPFPSIGLDQLAQQDDVCLLCFWLELQFFPL